MRLISFGLVGLALALAPFHGAGAQDWPSRTVTFVVPFPAAAPDGTTFLFGTPSPIAINKLMYKGLAYDSERDFMPVVLVAKSPLMVTAKSDFPAKTFAEL